MIERADRDGVRLLTLNRPPVNALDEELIERIRAAFADSRSDAACTAVVLGGAGETFCAGVDTNSTVAGTEPLPPGFARAINRMIAEVYSFPKPTVCAARGHVLGGGFVLALACDAIVTSTGNPKIGLIEARAGIPFPAGPLEVIRDALSPQDLRELAARSRLVTLGWLRERGIIEEPTSESLLLARSIEVAHELCGLPAFAAVKLQLRREAIRRLDEIATQ